MRNTRTVAAPAATSRSSAASAPARAARGPAAVGRLPETRYASKLEAAYAARLSLMLQAGEVVRVLYEPFNLRLADGTFYCPDFLVQLPNGSLEVHEVKGFWREDAWIKFKVAATLHSYLQFVAVTRVKGQWTEERRA